MKDIQGHAGFPISTVPIVLVSLLSVSVLGYGALFFDHKEHFAPVTIEFITITTNSTDIIAMIEAAAATTPTAGQKGMKESKKGKMAMAM